MVTRYEIICASLSLRLRINRELGSIVTIVSEATEREREREKSILHLLLIVRIMFARDYEDDFHSAT